VSKRNKVVVLGLGEVGKPLLELTSKYHETVGVDVAPVEGIGKVDVLHVCYPFQIKNFILETVRYIGQFQPTLTVINSTVGVGTTRAIAERSGHMVVNSPVRGKHSRMLAELKSYTKFIGAADETAGKLAEEHFQSVGLKTKVLSSPEASELAKLAETTYFGVLIAWAQELERYCDEFGAAYDEVVSFQEEVKFFPPVQYFPGVIGGHCVMPNIEILTSLKPSTILKAVQSSNKAKIERDARVHAPRDSHSTSDEGENVPAVA
jgi:UDP-N-acetyl-D-mannosaminuronate dehydrogenase